MLDFVEIPIFLLAEGFESWPKIVKPPSFWKLFPGFANMGWRDFLNNFNLAPWKWFKRAEKKNFEYDIINFVVVLKFWSVLFWEIWILFKNIRLFRKFFDGFMLILCLLYLDLHGARCLTAGTCAAHFMPCALPHPSSASRQKNTLLQVIICPLVLYWQRFLFRSDFPKFKVLKKVLKIGKKNFKKIT